MSIGDVVGAEADFIELFDDGRAEKPRSTDSYWKVAVIDDDAAVHEGTRFALRDYRLEGRGISLLSAHSAAEGRNLLREHPDVAVILLDVVMERDDAGLELVNFVRRDLGNETVRIILRTGQPGQAPERRVVVDYDINDYKAKTELTADKLFTALTAALRSYEQLRNLTEIRSGLEFVIESGARLLDAQHGRILAETALECAVTLLGVQGPAILALREASAPAPSQLIRKGQSDPELETLLVETLQARAGLVGATRAAFYADAGRGCEVALAITHDGGLSPTRCALAGVLCTRVSVVFDNLRLRQQLEASNADLERCVAERTKDLVAANQRLEAQGQTLRRSNAFKNEILGTIAHDLKNPLGVMLGRAQILQELIDIQPLPASHAETQIHEIGQAGQRLTSMIDSLISNAMLDAVDMTLAPVPLNLAALAREVVDANRESAARKAQTLRFEADGDLLALGDVDRLREAIDNFVDNAIKYSPAGSPIDVVVKREGEAATLQVCDRGPGLSPEDEARLFGRFQRLSAKPTGGESSTGLGLSITKRIVELHGGAVAATNRDGGGAVFSLSLPLRGPEFAH